MRQTLQKTAIFQEVQHRTDHPTAEQVYEAVKEKLPRVSLGTVYRNLDDLTRKGQIRKITLSHQKARYDGGLHPHDHILCVHCENIKDINKVTASHSSLTQHTPTGFVVHEIELVLKGLCPECQKTLNKESHNV